MAALDEVVDAVRRCQQFAPVKDVDVNLIRGGLIAAEEIAREGDAGDGQVQAPGQEDVNQAEADRISRAAIHDPV